MLVRELQKERKKKDFKGKKDVKDFKGKKDVVAERPKSA
jgi:hypothetical protein